MRTPLVAVVFGLSFLAGCEVGDPVGGGGDDQPGGAVCGNGVKEGNEACDDGNLVDGDRCSSSCTIEAQPRLDMVSDKVTLQTELKTTSQITVTLTSSGGFSGPVALTAAAVDGVGTPIPGWTVALNIPTVDVPADGTVDVVATLTIPSTNRGLNGTVKIDATSSLGPKSVSTTVMVQNQVSFEVTMNGNGQCVYTAVMGITDVTVGTKVRLVNKGTDNVIFHSDGGGLGLPHQSTTGTGSPANGSYEGTITSAGAAFGWYCHSPGPNPNTQQITVGIRPVAAQ
ncbi:MAG: myxococcus cysteine-rich repeat containing protein [Kofleriaceae bacterium]